MQRREPPLRLRSLWPRLLPSSSLSSQPSTTSLSMPRLFCWATLTTSLEVRRVVDQERLEVVGVDVPAGTPIEAVVSSFCHLALRRRASLLFAKRGHKDVGAQAHNSGRLESTSPRTRSRGSDENDRNSEHRQGGRERDGVRRPPRDRHVRPSSREERPSPVGSAQKRTGATAEPSKAWSRSRSGPSLFAGSLSLTGLAASIFVDLAALGEDGAVVGVRGTPTSAVELKTS